ncbi:DUF4286 family protein [Lentisalinibacter orientalis]|uniref:DUF4286 family protein n=1 Tax=Lentisalinibacter orientalis TaxID=2992241 RepID=UPI003863BE0F
MEEPRVIYEVTVACDPAVDGALRDWLPDHVGAMLELPGFTGARILDVVPGAEDEWPAHTVHYTLTDRAALEEYFASHGERMRAATERRFGDSVRIERRILTAAGTGDDKPAPPRCLNCGHVLHGQYCGICGQRSSSRLISLWGLITEGLGDLLDMDSRLWRTLRALLLRPGYLTAEYLEGRRARFMPPFRMYLAFSLIFFITAFFDMDGFQVEFGGDPGTATDEATRDAASEVASGIRDSIDGRVPPEEIERRAREPENAIEAEQGPEAAPDTGGDAAAAKADVDRAEENVTGACDDLQFQIGGWLGQRLTEERLREACQRVLADRGRGLGRALIDDLPTALFAFLPVLAFVLKVLYPLSRRYYVEHLLFIVHYQSFVFLVLTLLVLLGRLVDLMKGFDWIGDLGSVVVVFYIPVYLFRSLRRVYRQKFLVTFAKFMALSVAYFLAFVIMMTATFVVAALSL